MFSHALLIQATLCYMYIGLLQNASGGTFQWHDTLTGTDGVCRNTQLDPFGDIQTKSESGRFTDGKSFDGRAYAPASNSCKHQQR